MNRFLNFTNHCHHVLLGGEFIILSELEDEYILLGKIASRNLLIAMTQGVIDNSDITKSFLAKGIVAYADTPEKIREVPEPPTGIDNYEWRLTNEFITKKAVINPVSLFRTMRMLYKVKAQQDAGGIGRLLKMMREAKKNWISFSTTVETGELTNNMLATVF